MRLGLATAVMSDPCPAARAPLVMVIPTVTPVWAVAASMGFVAPGAPVNNEGAKSTENSE